MAARGDAAQPLAFIVPIHVIIDVAGVFLADWDHGVARQHQVVSVRTRAPLVGRPARVRPGVV